jgi:hypothetical protein
VTTLEEAIAAREGDDAAEWLVLPALAIPQTRWALTDLTVDEWRRIGAYLRGLLDREPVKTGAAWAGVRILLGTLAAELDGMVRVAGDDPAEAMALYDRSGERALADYRANAEALERRGVVLHGS